MAMEEPSREERRLEQRARRVAFKAGYTARKTRWRRNSIENRGGFCITDPFCNAIIAGERFDLSPEEVIQWCSEAATD
jgi:hypothetical protein